MCVCVCVCSNNCRHPEAEIHFALKKRHFEKCVGLFFSAGVFKYFSYESLCKFFVLLQLSKYSPCRGNETCSVN